MQRKEFVVEAGFDPMYGARPLKRYVQRQVETKLARELIAGTITDNSHVVVDVENNELVVHVNKIKRVRIKSGLFLVLFYWLVWNCG